MHTNVSKLKQYPEYNTNKKNFCSIVYFEEDTMHIYMYI